MNTSKTQKIQKTRTAVFSAAALSLALTLSACGGTGSTGDGSTPENTATPSEQTMSPSASNASSPEASSEMSSSEGSADTALMPESTGDPFADAMTAAAHMPMTAETMATGIATSVDISGDPGSEASTLRSTLTSQLQEHVYLAGMAVATAYATDPESEETQMALDTLDMNSQHLAETIKSASDQETADQFLELWRTHIGYFVDYAVAEQSGDDEAKQEALSNLEQYTQDAGQFFDDLTGGELPQADITESLSGHVDTLTQAIDSLAAGDAGAYDDLRMAASHVGEAAATISQGVATATDMEGDVQDDAATLRAGLTFDLQEHVYLASVAVFTAYTSEEGTDSEAFSAAAETLDANTMALAEKIGSVAGDEKEEQFLALWREHIGYFVDYANAKAMDDTEAAEQALMDLDGYRTQAGDFFEEISGGELPSEDVAEGLSTHVETLSGAIDSLSGALVSEQ